MRCVISVALADNARPSDQVFIGYRLRDFRLFYRAIMRLHVVCPSVLCPWRLGTVIT